MTHGFDCLWDKLVAKRPLLKDAEAKVTISPQQFKKLLKAFYDYGKLDANASADRTEKFLEKFFGIGGSDK